MPAPKEYKHAEAFCVMQYASDDGTITETLWNSRDGVTPFMLISKDGKTTMRHVNWANDKFDPEFKPPSGSRYFADLTKEQAKKYAKDILKRQPDYNISLNGLIKNLYDDGHRPDILTQP